MKIVKRNGSYYLDYYFRGRRVTVQLLMGHSRVAMTSRYVHPLASDKMAAVIKLDFTGVCSSPDPNRTPSPSGNDVKSEVISSAAAT